MNCLRNWIFLKEIIYLHVQTYEQSTALGTIVTKQSKQNIEHVTPRRNGSAWIPKSQI